MKDSLGQELRLSEELDRRQELQRLVPSLKIEGDHLKNRH